jgi:hypothetical protein
MKKNILVGIAILILASCKLQPDSERHYSESDKSKVYQLHLDPPVGSTYHYDITKESEIKLEVDDKKTDNKNTANFGVFYEINKDSSGNLLLNMSYDKIHVYTKKNDVETETDAADAANSIDPVERMLGYVKDAKISATISPTGELKSVTGYKELGEKMLANFDPNDTYGKNVARQQWEKLIGEGIVKKNVDELFRIFPDSAVHLGDTWKLTYKESGDIPLVSKTIFTLKDINDDIVMIGSEGVIISDSSSTGFMSFNNASIHVKGKQDGEYEIERKTGMLISCRVKANIEGTLEVAGREIPLTIETSLKLTGKKIK